MILMYLGLNKFYPDIKLRVILPKKMKVIYDPLKLALI